MAGSFNRIMKMAERQQKAAIEAAAEVRGFQKKDIARGHWLGFGVTVAAILGAAICAYMRQPWVAGALVGVPVLSVAKALVESVKTTPQPTTVAVPAEAKPSAASSPSTSG